MVTERDKPPDLKNDSILSLPPSVLYCLVIQTTEKRKNLESTHVYVFI